MDSISQASPITLNELPKHSDWPNKILGETDWTIPNRNIDKIREEYEQDKYLQLREFQRTNNVTDPLKIRQKQIKGRSWHFSKSEQSTKSICVSEDTELYVAPVLAAQEYNDMKVINTLRKVLNGGETVVELGCGYGYNLHVLNQEFPECEFFGGEFSENAVEIASNLFSDDDNITVEQFNYYNKEWTLFDRDTNNLVVFTRLSIEQLPQCGPAIERLMQAAGAELEDAIHLEPIYEMHDTESLLQLLRKKYAEINDYNRDLLTVLKNQSDISIQATEYDVFGFNGLNPMSLIHWQPV